MVWSRDLQGLFWMEGDPGGVAEGLWVGPRAGILALDIGELLGLLDRLALRTLCTARARREATGDPSLMLPSDSLLVQD